MVQCLINMYSFEFPEQKCKPWINPGSKCLFHFVVINLKYFTVQVQLLNRCNIATEHFTHYKISI